MELKALIQEKLKIHNKNSRHGHKNDCGGCWRIVEGIGKIFCL